MLVLRIRNKDNLRLLRLLLLHIRKISCFVIVLATERVTNENTNTDVR